MCRQWFQELGNGMVVPTPSNVKRADGLARFIFEVAKAKPASDEIYAGNDYDARRVPSDRRSFE